MTAPTPEATQPAVVALGDTEVDRIAAAVVTRLLDTKIKTSDAPEGRYLRTVLTGLFNGTQRLIRKTGA